MLFGAVQTKTRTWSLKFVEYLSGFGQILIHMYFGPGSISFSFFLENRGLRNVAIIPKSKNLPAKTTQKI
jgi:hypothetical protein